MGAEAENYDDPETRRSRIARVGATPSLMLTSNDRRSFLTLIDYLPAEVNFARSEKLTLFLSMARAGPIRRRSDAQMLEAIMHPGTVGIGVPGTTGIGGWGALRLLGLGIDLDLLTDDGEESVKPDAFVGLADRLHDDPLLAATMTALWRDAEAHGLGSAFFEQGAMLVGRRLRSMSSNTLPQITSVVALSRHRLARVIDLIEDRLADDVGVAELAAFVGMSRHHFGRALKASCGLTPFALITERRMLRAEGMLRDTQRSIIVIAASVGYANPGKFAEAFRRRFGMTPTQWRRSIL